MLFVGKFMAKSIKKHLEVPDICWLIAIFRAKIKLFGGLYTGIAHFQTHSQWIADHIGHLHLLKLLSHDTCVQNDEGSICQEN